MMKPDEAKRWLRRYSVRIRQSVKEKNKKAWSQLVARHFLRSPLYKKSKIIALFLGFASEVQTHLILNQAWKERKTVLIPMTTHGLDKPFFALFKKGDPLKKSRFGPWELVEKQKPFDFRKIDLVLVPGLAFDETGHRLGYGGGTYDRILEKTSRALHVGLFFSCQQLNRIPHLNHDQPLNAVVTENGLMACLAKSGN